MPIGVQQELAMKTSKSICLMIRQQNQHWLAASSTALLAELQTVVGGKMNWGQTIAITESRRWQARVTWQRTDCC
ncbi:MAG: hypothetical protein ACLRXQ_05410 [Phascolarctobacterium faecium]